MDAGMTDQLTLDPLPEIPAHRVRALAGVLAGFRYPGRNSFEDLKKAQQYAVLVAAREALIALAGAPE